MHLGALSHLHAFPEDALADYSSMGQLTLCPKHSIGPQAHIRGKCDIRPQHHRGDKSDA